MEMTAEDSLIQPHFGWEHFQIFYDLAPIVASNFLKTIEKQWRIW